jgi:hypothetical protein
MVLLAVLACGEPSGLNGPCRWDDGCAGGLVCVKDSIVESHRHTCRIPCDPEGNCPRIPGAPGACSFCLDAKASSGRYCLPTGCS